MARQTVTEKLEHARAQGYAAGVQACREDRKVQSELAKIELAKALAEVAKANSKIAYSIMLTLNGKTPYNG